MARKNVDEWHAATRDGYLAELHEFIDYWVQANYPRPVTAEVPDALQVAYVTYLL